jgi:class 3 adenylate cyclase/tetratricopeptide (TPR) repeat protein
MQTKLFCSVLTFLFSLQTFSQGKIDSLQILLKKDKEDTNKVNHLNNLCHEYADIGSYDTALYYSNAALELSQKINFQIGVAEAYNGLAILNFQQGNYSRSLEVFLKALKIDEALKDTDGIGRRLGNIGIIYKIQGDYSKALDYYFRSLKIDEGLGHKDDIATDLGNIGNVYKDQGDNSKALDYYFKALKIAEETGNKKNNAYWYGNIGLAYKNQGNQSRQRGDIAQAKQDYTNAMEYYMKALEIDKALGNKTGIARHLGNIGRLCTERSKMQPVLKLQKAGYAEAERYLVQALSISESIGALNLQKDHQNNLSEVYEQMGNYKQAMEHYRKAIVLQDTLFTQEKNKEITRKEMNYEFEKKEMAAKAEQDKKDAITQHQIQKQKIIRNSTIGGLAVVLIFSIVVFTQKKKITRGKKRSDDLLLNILPWEVAEELKRNGESEANQFDDVTVLLTDFVNFTGASEKLTPKELVGEIHHCFTAFDEIIGRNGLEKIKTTGDAYLAVCGLPNSDQLHARKTVTAAQEILKFMSERKEMFGLKDGFGDVRIGINSGSVVAGIVGVKKFAYDIWGDTVNVAARMEQNCEAGKINISGTTYELIKDEFNCIHRGKIEAKNKGMIDMYFVEQRV